EIGADHEELARAAVDEWAEHEAEDDRRQDVRDEPRADPPTRGRPIVDVDLERDDGEPVADTRRERRQEEQPELPVAEQRESGDQTPGQRRPSLVVDRQPCADPLTNRVGWKRGGRIRPRAACSKSSTKAANGSSVARGSSVPERALEAITAAVGGEPDS